MTDVVQKALEMLQGPGVLIWLPGGATAQPIEPLAELIRKAADVREAYQEGGTGEELRDAAQSLYPALLALCKAIGG